jgi:L-ascorbate 6-phosphate lactonase
LDVPENRIIKVKPGDLKHIKDTKIIALESYDEMAKRTGHCAMEEAAVTYLLNTPGGNVFHIGDSVYSNHYYRIGRENKIDIALINTGGNPPGVTDKLTVFDAYRVARMLGAKVVIPMHYDNWAITQENPLELERIVKERAPNIKTVIMQWGGKFQYPQDQDIGRYKYSQQDEKFNPERSLEYGTQRKF